MVDVTSDADLTYWTTAEIKNQILELVKDRNREPLKAKVEFYKNELAPYFAELSRRNPFDRVVDQVAIVIGVWIPIWSTIPFQDILPGRIHEQSYQIFHNDGYYANIARYAPGHQSGFWQKIASKIPAYDLMLLQKYSVRDEQWDIKNVGIFQALKNREIPLTIDDADKWFTTTLESKFKGKEATQNIDLQQELKLKDMDRNTVKKFEKVYLATSFLEHLYIDNDFRLVKSQREATQRPSYTIAVRKR
ncbi:MAG: hypothetical protein RMZ41_023750 [Nostoc sp. DedVER02]|uniref:hypothetical protein n=1 Tax=unclassified Nostoc TaxID=2593658 RepID=UPI002AD45724|nr:MULTISPECIES: hypothetical protein [unclassified Nostoc]MDZ7984594.1 hypothetical protein [Nostoc sp. DedVER02]MDZ8114438.1 hypothetical protein [Nostoc sp. DedVER01b]